MLLQRQLRRGELAILQALRVGDSTTFNMFVKNSRDFAGYASIPTLMNMKDTTNDGVFIHEAYLPGGPRQNREQDKTLIHEVEQ